jgi:hypothetical protein
MGESEYRCIAAFGQVDADRIVTPVGLIVLPKLGTEPASLGSNNAVSLGIV